jgi:hypothetical protein
MLVPASMPLRRAFLLLVRRSSISARMWRAWPSMTRERVWRGAGGSGNGAWFEIIAASLNIETAMKKLLVLFALSNAYSCVAHAQPTWTQPLTEAITGGIAKAPDDPKITDWIQAIGTLLAVAIAIWVPWRQNHLNRKEDANRQAAEVASFLRAIRAEVKGAWDNYNVMVRSAILNVQADQFLGTTFRFSEKAFSIYDNSGVQVGKISDEELQALIVRTYGLAKSLIVSTQINNEMLQQLERQDQHQLGVIYVQRPDVRKALIEYATTLKLIDAALETSVKDLIARLDSYLVLAS